jgi:hypothetical protein
MCSNGNEDSLGRRSRVGVAAEEALSKVARPFPTDRVYHRIKKCECEPCQKCSEPNRVKLGAETPSPLSLTPNIPAHNLTFMDYNPTRNRLPVCGQLTMRNNLLVYLVSVCSFYSSASTNNWQRADEGSFSFEVPKLLEKQIVHPIDSHCGTYSSAWSLISMRSVFPTVRRRPKPSITSLRRDTASRRQRRQVHSFLSS